MRMSRLFSQTLREAPAEAEIASHRLLLRAGFIRQHAAGIFSYLPLGQRTKSKIEAILRQEMDAIGGQEISMPVVQPAEIWKETGRWESIDAEMGRLKDRSGRELALAMTHEEALADLVRREIRSYRQLPALLYHIQTKWRDDPRPRAGLIRVREFTMKDSYSLDADWEGLERQYQAHYKAYFRIFQRCGLPVIAVRADTGMMGGRMAHEFMYLTPVGEDTLLICNHCGYAANRQVATFRKPSAPVEAPLELERVATPGTKTIEDLAAFLGISKARTAKAVFLMASIHESGSDGNSEGGSREQLVFAIVRGDMEVNENKLANAVRARSLRPATEEEIRAAGAVPGYASPVGLSGVLVVVDDAVVSSPNLVAGANEEGYHLRNVNYGRDFQAQIVTDIAAAGQDDPCPQCGQPMNARRGVEVGNIFQLGTRYSEPMGCYFLSPEGDSRPVIMGSYGIGVGRLIACIAEEWHDEHGLTWPVSVAPYQVHLVLLSGKGKDPGAVEAAENLYRDLQAAGVEVLYDDRDETPGVKFNDADLIGLPIRLTISPRALGEGGVEFRLRTSAERRVLPLDEIIPFVQEQIADLFAAIEGQVHPVPYT
jgi:prolyl-tRNA synthetase